MLVTRVNKQEMGFMLVPSCKSHIFIPVDAEFHTDHDEYNIPALWTYFFTGQDE